ncbi:MAG: hypothetical protein JNM41_16045 [Flavipsychrobacter sp.]|nr:hypothetical protein [Flavipsychrobacter sp.]
MIEVFKTNVENHDTASTICSNICRRPGISSATFDLDDCDRILRVEGADFDSHQIKSLVEKMGYECEVLI